MLAVGVLVGTSDGSDTDDGTKIVGIIDGWDDDLLEGKIDGIVIGTVVGDTVVTIAVGLAVDILDGK